MLMWLTLLIFPYQCRHCLLARLNKVHRGVSGSLNKYQGSLLCLIQECFGFLNGKGFHYECTRVMRLMLESFLFELN